MKGFPQVSLPTKSGGRLDMAVFAGHDTSCAYTVFRACDDWCSAENAYTFTNQVLPTIVLLKISR